MAICSNLLVAVATLFSNSRRVGTGTRKIIYIVEGEGGRKGGIKRERREDA